MGRRAYRLPMIRLQPPRHAFTLIELTLVLAISGLVAAVGLRQMHRYLDRLATRAAISDAALVFAEARDAALAQHAPVAIRIDTVAGTIALFLRGDRFAFHALAHQHAVHLSTTRDSIAFDVRGLGYGAANLTLVARRGGAVDTLIVSRLGRTRS
jgi:prepilin-type N-terminal cleavage/methylation domain-containing protein